MFALSAALAAVMTYCILAIEHRGLDISYDWGIARCSAGFFLGPSLILLGSHLNRFASTHGALFARAALAAAQIAAVMAAIAVMCVATGAAVVSVIPLFFFAVALLQTDEGPVAHFLQHRWIQFLGQISYSIYMVQLLIVVSTTIILKRMIKVPLSTDPLTHKATMVVNPWLGDILVAGIIATVLVVASLTYHWVEVPGRAYGRRLVERAECP
jgi:peptidoglycan/LPS O-acetylase OafA/YrhL